MKIHEKELLVSNKLGLHVRASAKLVGTATLFKSDIHFIRENTEVDCKSILDVMSMACSAGTSLTVRARGVDAEAAVAAIEKLMINRFGEE